MILRPRQPQPAKLTPLDKLLAEPVYKGIPIAVVQHCEAVPLGVMVRGTMEWLLIQEGQAGTSIPLRAYEYIPCCTGSSSSSSNSGSSSVPAPFIYFVSEEIVFPSDTDPTREIITSYAYTFYPGTCAVQQRVTTLPVISTAQNGNGIAATRREYFDIYSNLTWQMDERGFLTRTSYDIATKAVTQLINDVDTPQVDDAPPGWETPTGGGLHLISDLEFDVEGRTTQILGPCHVIDIEGVATTVRRATWTVYQDAIHQVWTGMGYATGTAPTYTFTLINPVSLSIFDADNRPLESIQATRTSTSGQLLPTDSFPQTSYVRWTTMQYGSNNLLASQRVYHTIPATGNGFVGVNFDQTNYGYDEMERQNWNVTGGGTITRTVFDVRNNAISIYIGTDDAGATNGDPTGGGAPGNNMVIVSANQFDDGLAGGDNNLTMTTQYVDASTTRVTSFLFDWRDRRTDIDGEIDFYQRDYYDNLNRLVKTERYNTTATGNLIARSESNYDDRNRVYQTIRYGVDPSTGTVGNALTDNTWFDPSGNVLKSMPAGSSLFTKPVFDGAGRQIVVYQGYDLGESEYPTPCSLLSNTIIEQAETTYDPASNAIAITLRMRYHNATGVGPLGSPSSTEPKARVTYQAAWQDALGRLIASADYGTNGAVALVRSDTIPARTDYCLVTSNVYDDSNNLETITDPAGMVTLMEYDAVGREVARIVNYQAGSSSSSSSSSSGGCPSSADSNITVLKEYNPDGNVSAITAVNSATGNQTTQYVYGTTLSDSSAASTLLKRFEILPDSVSGSDQIAFTYDRQNEVVTLTDQNGTVHAYDRDLLARNIEDRVTTLGTGVDGAILRIATTYEVRGMVQNVTSYDNATIGSGSVVNDTQMVYNDFGQLIADYQNHNGAVDLSTTPNVQYGYANGSANTIRPTTMTYPNGRVLNYTYGSTGSMNDLLSRTASLIDNNGVTHLADYSYLGLGAFVEVDYTQPSIYYTLVGTAGGIDPVTGDIYRGLDRFSRVKDLQWNNYSTSTDVERIKYGYDRVGNRLYRMNTVDPARLHDEYYWYDRVDRLSDMERGTLNSTNTGISTLEFAQCWSLDETGNWSGFREDDTGDGTWDLIQTRNSNSVNEIVLINANAGPAWATPAYDGAGNMTIFPQPIAPPTSFDAVFDAWNRVVQLITTGNLVAKYQFDGFSRRAVSLDYTGGIFAETRHHYYSIRWQVLEERIDSATLPERQFVWGIRHVDDVLVRDRNTDSGPSLNERLYGLQDAIWSVTAIASDSGIIQERYCYAAYGHPGFLDSSFASRSNSFYDWETLFAGYRFDSASGQFNVRFRVYNPFLGSWLSRDPLGLESDLNLYRYVWNQPMRFLDVSGLGWTWRGCVGGGTGAAAGGALAGAGIGVWFFGAGAAPGALIGGTIGAVGGCVAGGFLIPPRQHGVPPRPPIAAACAIAVPLGEAGLGAGAVGGAGGATAGGATGVGAAPFVGPIVGGAVVGLSVSLITLWVWDLVEEVTENAKRQIRCSCIARGACPPGCGLFRAEAPTMAECKVLAFALCVAAGCHQPGRGCDCGHCG